MYDSRWVAPRPWTTFSNSPSYSNTDNWGVSGTLSWDLRPLQLKSITAYRDLRAAAKTDADGTPFDIVASDGLLVQQHQVSQDGSHLVSYLPPRMFLAGARFSFD